jgi:glycosyltransferase involved in cell wall biosynthesis
LEAAKALADHLGVASRVRFLPWQSDLSALYPALDAVLIPSRYEGVPLVMLEAMARHIPVLASDVDGMADVLPAACLFGMGDADAMVEKLRALPQSPGETILNELFSLVQTRLNATAFAARFADELVRLSNGGAP